jgi:4-amino-4-deoxychorismate lyase
VDADRILVDGEPGGRLSALDRGLAFGDGVFRTLRVSAGRPLNWGRHCERLRADCALLGLTAPDEALLRAELARVAPGEAIAKILVTRGAGGRGYALPSGVAATRVVAAFEAPPPTRRASEGVRVRRCALVLSEQPWLAGAKTLNRLENVLARAEWDDPDIAEGLLCDAAGRVVEGTMSNVFAVRAGVLATPALTRCGVAGAQRARVLEMLDAKGVRCEVRDMPFEELAGADEVFLTNSVIGAWPVTRIAERELAAGPVTRAVQRHIEEDDARD